jgi:hypothetical protein
MKAVLFLATALAVSSVVT